MAVIKMTLPFVKTVPVKEKLVNYFDEALSGFALRVYPSGVKTFSIKYRNKFDQQRFFKVGSFPNMTLEQAKERARGLLRDIELGKDPAKEKSKNKEVKTVSELCDWYMKEATTHKKPRTIIENRSCIERLIKPLIGKVPTESLTKGQIETMKYEIIKGDKVRKDEKSDKLRGRIKVRGGNAAAGKAVSLLGTILEFGISKEQLQINPARGIKKPPLKPKEEFLTLEEIKKLGNILSIPKWSVNYKDDVNAIKLLLLTGCRKNEILTLKWQYVDFQNQCFRFPDTKTGKQIRPFGIGALRLLQQIRRENNSEWVIPSRRTGLHLVNLRASFISILESKDETENKILEKEKFTIHSLRHTFTSVGADLGYTEFTLAGLVGHKLKGITNRYSHLPDKSLIASANHISSEIEHALKGTKEDKIIDISKRA